MKFGLRDLLWLVTLCCVIFAWHRSWNNQQLVVKSLESTIDKLCKERHDWFWREGHFRDMPDSEWQMYDLPKLEEKK